MDTKDTLITRQINRNQLILIGCERFFSYLTPMLMVPPMTGAYEAREWEVGKMKNENKT